jgi:MFS family permease
MQLAAPALATRIRWRLAIPTIVFMLLSSLDRVNISFAALQMNRELGFSPSQYGFGAGILFLGFLAGQYPSVVLLQRLGMHRWISGCAVVWGICAAALAFVKTPTEFYVLRVLLGFAEGGLGPGIVLYLSRFATEDERASTFALPMLAIPISIVFGSPVSGWLMGMHEPLGMASWRWMLVAESIPTVVLGVVAWFYFPDSPEQTPWLDADEKRWLRDNAANHARRGERSDWSVLRQPLVWSAGVLWFCLLSGSYGIMFWLPQMIKAMSGLDPFRIGLVNSLPWAGALVGMYYNSKHSDRTGERFLHISVPASIAAAAILAAWALGAGIAGLFVLFIAGIGLGAAQGAFWALPTKLLKPAELAIAAVAINVVGSSGGLVMPHVVGYVLERTRTFLGPTLLISLMLLLSAVLVRSIKLLFFPRAAQSVQQ